ncbi:MAG TPA: ribulose phosphate epimerase [Nannocystis sp.]|jgi:hypothetical protein
MRSTLLKLCLLPTLVALAGCGKDSENMTMATAPGAETTGGDGTTSGGQSETGAVVTGEPTTTGAQQTTTGAETSAANTGDSSGSTGSSFLTPPDGGSVNDMECSVWDQDCPVDQKCMPWANNGSTAWNATKCVPVDPAKGQPGDTCTVEGSAVSGLDTCDLGVLCWDVKPATMMGTCVAQCKGPESDPTCDANSSCFISNDGVLTLCLPKCDPLTQDCPNENLCIPNPQNQEEFTCVLDASGDGGQTFNPCEFVNACDKGHFCATPGVAPMDCDANATGCCLPFCDTTEMPASCPGTGLECVPWYEEGQAPPDLATVGLCMIPMP